MSSLATHPSSYALIFWIVGGLFCCPSISVGQDSPEPGDIVVNEILYDQTTSQTEFIELFNRSDRTLDLRDLTVADNRDQPLPITSDEHLLDPGAFAVLVDEAELFQSTYPSIPFIAPSQWNGLNNSGDTVILYAGDMEIDRVPYEPSWGGDDGVSLERVDPFGPSDTPANFDTSTDPTGATPGAPNSIFAPDTTAPSLIFAEEQTPNEVLLVVSEPLAESMLRPETFRLADGRPPTAISVQSPTHLLLTFDSPLTGLEFRATSLRDRAGNVRSEAAIPLAYQPKSGELAINEILFDPRADDFDHRPNQPEYFELYNRTDRTLTLRHAFWTDRPTEQNVADTTRIGSVFLSAPPRSFTVVFAEPDVENDLAVESALARAFPQVDLSAPSVTLVPIPSQQLGLLNSGDWIRWHRADGQPISTVAYTPDWHAPGLAATKGVALERISTSVPADDPTNWTSSVAPNGGTPGTVNSVALPDDAPPPANAVTITPSPFSPDGDGIDDVARIRYQLESPASLIRLRIYDARGRQVYHRDAELAGSTGELLWDGRDGEDRPLRLGIYVVLFEAVNADRGTVRAFKRPVVLARQLH